MPSTPKEDVDRIVEAVIYLTSESRRATKEIARQHGLTGPQVTAAKLLETLGDLSLSALSERMSAKNSTITGIVDRMERDGLVSRARSETDRRVTLIRLTEAGRKLAASIPLEPMQVFTRALASLRESERDDLRRLLRKLTDAVRREVVDAPEVETARERG